MVHAQADSTRLLVHLISRLACSPEFRAKILDSVAAYLARVAEADGVAVEDIMADQETYVLGPLYCMLMGFHESYLLEGITPRQADAKAAHWLSERLAEFTEH